MINKIRSRKRFQQLVLSLLIPAFAVMPGITQANPTGGVVVHGDVGFEGLDSSNLQIFQGSDKAIINWQDFSIGAGEITQFIQPGKNSMVLNRVVSGNPSAIFGTLKANGGVMVVNTNGILVGAGGVVDVAGALTLSTLDIDDNDFLNGGDNRFRGNSSAGVTNYGTISAGGDVILLGNFIDNRGTIGSVDGTIAMGAGGDIIVHQSGDAKISVKAAGRGGQVGINNEGTVEGAAVELKAHGNVYALAINNSGMIRANGANFKGGILTLDAGPGGVITNTGTLQAQNSDGSGGTININAGPTGTVNLEGGEVDASGTGDRAGGVIDVQGAYININGGALINADGGSGGVITIGNESDTQSVIIEGGSTVSAVGSSGDGGMINVTGRADSVISVGGDLLASGSVNGGTVNVIGGTVTQFGTSTIDAAGGSGTGGAINLNGAESVLANGMLNASSVSGDAGSVTVGSIAGDATFGGTAAVNSLLGGGGNFDLVSREAVNVTATASADVSGFNRAGRIRAGGGFQGNDSDILNSQSTNVEAGAEFVADSEGGNAGRVIIWSDGDTTFSGSITARALGAIGNGGFMEVSGKEQLEYRGRVNASAVSGANGTLLLDPTDVVIGPGAGVTITDSALVDAILTNNVVIHTSGAGTAAGNIVINAGSDIQYDSPNSLAFFAHGDINVNGDIKNHGTSEDAVVDAAILNGLDPQDAPTTGNISLVAGWDGTGAASFAFDPTAGTGIPAVADPVITAADILAGTYGAWGQNGGSVFLNDAATEIVEVGSARGETNAFGDVVRLSSGNGGSEFTQLGYRRENDLRGVAKIAGGGTINTGLDLDFANGVTGDINVNATTGVFMVRADGTRSTDRAYVMIGHGGMREQDNDADNRNVTNTANFMNDSLSVVDYGSDVGNVTVGNGNNSGDITINAGQVFVMQAGRAESFVQVGHGGLANDDPDADRANTVSDSGLGDNVTQNIHIFGNMTGDITVRAGSIEMEGGLYQDTFAMIGNGGTRVRGDHSGNITVEATVGDINAIGAVDTNTGWSGNGRDQSFVQIGNGGYDSDFLFLSSLGESGAYKGAAGLGADGLSTQAATRGAYDTSGGVPRQVDDVDAIHLDARPRRTINGQTNTSHAGEGVAINPDTGISYGHSGDISVIASGSVNFTASNGNDTYAMIGHGGRDTHGDHRGDITVTATRGNVIFTRDAFQLMEDGLRDIRNLGNRSHVQIGHGGGRFAGGAIGDIAVTAGGSIEFYAGRSESFAMIGHGGRGLTDTSGSTLRNTQINGTLEGDITVIAGDDIKFRSGFGSGGQAFSQIGHGGYFLYADVVGDGTAEGDNIVGAGPGVTVSPDEGAQSVLDEGFHGDIIVTSGGDISFIAGQTETLNGQDYMEANRYENYTMIGHGGERARGDHYGNITVTAAGDLNLEARGGWDSVSIENNGGDGGTNAYGTPRLNSTEDSSRTGYRNFAQIGHGGYDSEHRSNGTDHRDNDTGKQGTGIGTAGESNIVVNVGGNLTVLAAQKDTTADKLMTKQVFRDEGDGSYYLNRAEFNGNVMQAGGTDSFVIIRSLEIFDGVADGITEVSLLGDGVKTLATLRDEWNAANPNNRIAVDDGTDRNVILEAGLVVTLTGEDATLVDLTDPTVGAEFSQHSSRINILSRGDGEQWVMPDAVLSVQEGYAQIGHGGDSTDYHANAITGVAEQGEGHRGDITITAGGDIRVEASDIKQAVSSGQLLEIDVRSGYTGAGATGANITRDDGDGSGAHFVGPGIGADAAADSDGGTPADTLDDTRFINGDNSQNDPTTGIQGHAMIGLGGNASRGDHMGNITITAGGNLDLIAGEGREAFAQIGTGGYDSDRVNSDNSRNNDIGMIGDITIDIEGKLTMKGGGLQNGDTTGSVASYTPETAVDAGDGFVTVTTDNDIVRGSYVQIGSGGMSTGGSHDSNIDIVTGTGVEVEAGNSHRGGYGIIGSGGTWGRSHNLSGDVSVVAETGNIDLIGPRPVLDTLDDAFSGPANLGNLQTARENYVQIGNGGFDTDAQGGDQNNSAGNGEYSGDITVVAVEGSISLKGGGDDLLHIDNDNMRALSVQIGNGGFASDGDSTGDIRVAAGTDLSIVGGDGGRHGSARIGHGGVSVNGDNSGTIDIDVGNNLFMQNGSMENSNGIIVRDADAKIGHGTSISQGNGNNGSGTFEGDITISVGERIVTLNGVNGDGTTNDIGAQIGHVDTKRNTNPAINTEGDTFIAASRNNPTTGTGSIILSNGTVVSSADGGFLTELRLYMPTPAQDLIAAGAWLNNNAYTRSPTVGTRSGADEQIATEHTLDVGLFGEPSGEFATPAEGDYPFHGFGLYNIYFFDPTVVPVVPPAVVGVGGTPVEPLAPEVVLVPTPFNFFPFLFLDQYDSFGRDENGLLFGITGEEGGLFSAIGLFEANEEETEGAGPFFLEELLDESFGDGKGDYTESEEQEEQERREARLGLPIGGADAVFYVFDPDTNKYSSFRVFGSSRGGVQRAQ